MILMSFEISLHKKDKVLLEQIQAYFGGVGSITKQGLNLISYRVGSKEALTCLISHFVAGVFVGAEIPFNYPKVG